MYLDSYGKYKHWEKKVPTDEGTKCTYVSQLDEGYLIVESFSPDDYEKRELYEDQEKRYYSETNPLEDNDITDTTLAALKKMVG